MLLLRPDTKNPSTTQYSATGTGDLMDEEFAAQASTSTPLPAGKGKTDDAPNSARTVGSKRRLTQLSGNRNSKRMAANEGKDMLQQIKEYFDPKFNTVNDKVDDVASNVETISTSVTNLTGQVNLNAEEIRKLKRQLDQKKADLPGLREEVKKIVDEMNLPKNTQPTLAEVVKLGKDVEALKAVRTAGSISSMTDRPDEDSKYWIARRTLRLWPVTGSSQQDLWKNTGDFLIDVLKIPEGDIEEESVERVRRVNSGRRKHTKTRDEVAVLFRDVETRDTVYSYAPNLSGQQGRAGLRIEVPCHLLGRHKCLTRYGGQQKEKEGNGFKWNIKYDDLTQTLCIDTKLPGSASWERIDMEEVMATTSVFRGRFGSDRSGTSGASGEDSPDIEMLEERNIPLPQSATLQKFTKSRSSWGQRK